MTAPDLIIAYTMRDLTTLACPLCGHTEDAPPVPVSDQLGAVFGMSGDTLARVHAEQVGKRVSASMRRHLETHTVEQWLAAVVPDGVASQTSLPSRPRAEAGQPRTPRRTASAETTTGASTVPAGQGTNTPGGDS